MIYCRETGGIYAVPIEEATGGHLRVDPPVNGQAKRIRWASDYELPGALARAGPQPARRTSTRRP
jgi:hypothetical protein